MIIVQFPEKFRNMPQPLYNLSLVLLLHTICTLVRVTHALGNNDETLTDSTLGEIGRPKIEMSSDEKKLEDICKCLHESGQCLHKLWEYGPIIRQGTCYGNLRTRNKRAKRGDGTFSSPPTFIENKKCQGTKTIVLASSGKERQLTLTTPASVFICAGSIETNLQQLFVTGVGKIVIAKGALQERDSDLEIRLSSLEEKVVIPEGAFSIQIALQEQSSHTHGNEVDETPKAPPRIRLEIDTANEIEFKSRSIVAPIAQVKVNQVKKVTFGSNSIIPYAHPEASTLEVSHCHYVTMETQTINTGRYEAKNINHLFMKEHAVEVVSEYGAKAKIEYVSNITLLDEALSIGSGADILLNNLTFTSAGVRAIKSNGPGFLRRAAITYVAGKQFESVALCIRAETAVVYNVEIRGNNDSVVGACIEGQIIHTDEKPSETVGCDTIEGSAHLCNNTACAPCEPESLANTKTELSLTAISTPTPTIRGMFFEMPVIVNTTPVELSSMTSPDYRNEINPFLMDVTFHTHSYPEDYDYLGDRAPQTLLLPMYVIIICVCGTIIFLIFIIYMVYRCCTCNKHYKYYLPRENRLTTFHNPRTIMTPENLTRQSNTIQSNVESPPPQVYMNYDGYRQPTVTYTVTEPIDIASPILEEHLENSPPPAYEPHDSHDQGYNIHKTYYGNCEEGDSGRPYYNGDNLPLSENQIPPPPEGYCQADDQIPTSRISLSSESSSDVSTSSEDELECMETYIPVHIDNLQAVNEQEEQGGMCCDKDINDDVNAPHTQYSVGQDVNSFDNNTYKEEDEGKSLNDEMFI